MAIRLLFVVVAIAICALVSAAVDPHKLVAKTAPTTPRLIRPEGVDPALDCGIRKLALQFAGTLLDSDLPLSSVHDALQLGPLCGLEAPSDPSPRVVRTQAAVGDLNVFVDPVNGDDNNSGAQGQPVKTIAVAVDRTRVAGRGSATINLQGGVYRPSSTILLGVSDSNLTIQVDPSSQSSPFVSAAAPLSLTWTRAHGSVYVADVDPSVQPFTQLFVGSDEPSARRAIRARYPNCNPETCGLHTTPTGYVSSAQSWLPPAAIPAAVEVDISSPFRERSFFSTFSTGIGGPAQYLNPPNSYWAIGHGGAGSPWQVPSGLTFNSTDLPHAATWTNPATGVVHAFHSGHWGNWQFPVDSMPNSSTLAFGVGGYQEARGSASGSEYYVENIFEELDSPNEWFFDADSYKLYFFANDTEPSQLQFFASQLETLFSVTGSSLHPVANLALSGLTFAFTTTTFLADYEAPSGGDATVHRGGAVFVEGAVNVTVQYCKFYSIGGNGLFLSNYIRGAAVLNSEFVWLGDSGILAVGSTDMMDGTTGEQPRGTLVQGNLIHEIGVFGKQTSAYFQSLACQSTIRGNVFFNGPRAGVNFNDGFGGGNMVEGNLMFNFVRETSDHGPFNSWDRQPYLTDLADGTPSLNISENFILRNFILSAYHTSWPIDHDDGSVYYTDSFNLLVYGGFKSYWGHSKKALNNLYIHPELSSWGTHCMNDYGQDTDNNGWGESWSNNTCVIASPQVYDLGNCNYPDPAGTIPALAFNAFFVPNAQLSLNCGGTNLTLQQFQAMGYDVGSTVQDLPSTQDTLDMIVNFLGL